MYQIVSSLERTRSIDEVASLSGHKGKGRNIVAQNYDTKLGTFLLHETRKIRLKDASKIINKNSVSFDPNALEIFERARQVNLTQTHQSLKNTRVLFDAR